MSKAFSLESQHIAKLLINQMLDKAEELRDQLDGSVIADDLETAIEAVAIKYHIVLQQ